MNMKMKSINSDYTGCSVFIYDESGNRLGNTYVTYYNRSILRIEVEEPPSALDAGDACKLLILTSPSPCEYMGRIIRIGKRKPIAMYRGREREKRAEVRYNVNMPAFIDNYICDGGVYPLHTPLQVEMINVSKSGARFRTPYYALNKDDRFLIRVKINRRFKLVIAEVMNQLHIDTSTSEYGCRFLVSGDGGVCYEY